MKKGWWLLGLLVVLAVIVYFFGGFTSDNATVDPIVDTEEVGESDELLEEEIEAIVEEELEEAEEEDIDVDDDVSILNLDTVVVNGNGTEPFWSFVTSGATLIFNEPSESGPMLTTSYAVDITQNLTGDEVTIIHPAISIVVTLGSCSDGMSDIAYDYTAVVTRSGDLWNGCANIN